MTEPSQRAREALTYHIDRTWLTTHEKAELRRMLRAIEAEAYDRGKAEGYALAKAEAVEKLRCESDFLMTDVGRIERQLHGNDAEMVARALGKQAAAIEKMEVGK